MTLKYGGVVFILVYLTMFLILGAPMLLLEMTLGQYGGMAPTKMFRNICPVSILKSHIFLKYYKAFLKSLFFIFQHISAYEVMNIYQHRGAW